MIRMAFFAERPITVIRPTLKNTSFGKPRKLAPEQRTEHAQRHDQQHRHRNRPALVQRRRGTGTPRAATAPAGWSPANPTASLHATARSTRSRSPVAAARPGAPSRRAPRPYCGPAPRRRRYAWPDSRCSGSSAPARSTHVVVAKADSGTSAPPIELVDVELEQVVGLHAELGESACTITRCRRPEFGKSLT